MKPDAVIVLGAAVWPGGIPSRTLQRRTDAGIALFGELAGETPPPFLILSGGLGRHPPSEAEVMAGIAADAGIERSQMLLEDRSTSTLENLAFSMNLLLKARKNNTPPKVIVVTDAYHARRAVMIARGLGMDASAHAIPRSAATSALRWLTMVVRDWLATPASWWRLRRYKR